MKKAFFLTLLSVIFSVLAHADITLTPKAGTFGQDNSDSGIRTIYFPVKPAAAIDCNLAATPQLFPSSLQRIDISTTAAGLEFSISTDDDLSDINGGSTPTLDTNVCIRVEDASVVGNNPVALVRKGTNYCDGTSNYLGYGQTKNAQVNFALSTVANPEGQAGASVCSLTSGTDCSATAGNTPDSVTLKFGLIRNGKNFGNAADNEQDALSANVKVVFVNCPPTSTTGSLSSIFLSFGLIKGDQRIKMVNTTPKPIDGAGLHSVVVFGSSTSENPTTGSTSDVKTEFGSLAGLYELNGLANDKRYCFSLGFVNNGGLMSTTAAWDSTLATNLDSSVRCGTPSQVSGFLDRSTCFIASAAYGDEWDERLEVLRQFRDQVLSQSAAGRKFVEWYYSWSPEAATWLMENERFKSFVRAALFPMVESARVTLWLRNNLWAFAVFFVIGTAGLVVVASRRLRES